MNEAGDSLPYTEGGKEGTIPRNDHSTPDDVSNREKHLQKEIEELKRIIGRFFSIYDVQIGHDAIAFFIRINEEMLEENFENVRNMLKPDYIPVLTFEGGEHIMYVASKPHVRYKSSRVNLILLIITIITTTIAGATQWLTYSLADAGQSVEDIDVWASLLGPETLFFGALFFSLPLLLILGTHELGHYAMARRHGVAASLPFFIPMIPPLGTLGAVISMREPIPNKKALIDIGAAGPIAGLIVAIPVTLIGLHLTSIMAVEADPTAGGGLELHFPLLLIGLDWLLPIKGNVLAHPTFFAGWVGILVTALNLLPAGQLDGGHIVRALFGDKTKYIGISTVIIMLFLGFFFNYYGYVFLIIVVIVLGGGLRHPPPLNDITRLDKRRVMVGVLALVVFIVSFHPAPIQNAPMPNYGFVLDSELNETSLNPGEFISFNLSVMNIGDAQNDVFLNATLNRTRLMEGWNVTLTWTGEEETKVYNITDIGPLGLTVEEEVTEKVLVEISVPENAISGSNSSVTINMRWFYWVQDDVGAVDRKEKETSEQIVVKID